MQRLKEIYLTILMSSLFLACPVFAVETGADILKGGGGSGVDVRGSVMVDFSNFDGAHVATVDGVAATDNAFILRRARVTFEDSSKNDWNTKLQIDVNRSNVYIDSSLVLGVGDAYVQYSPDSFDLTIGRSKEPFGLERMTASKNLAFTERTTVMSAFAPGRNMGIKFSGDYELMSWAAGAFQNQEVIGGEDTTAITGRITGIPFQSDSQLVHLGLAASSRALDADVEFDIGETAEVFTAFKMIESDTANADDLYGTNVTLIGVEAAWVYGPFSMQAEYVSSSLEKTIDEGNDYDPGTVLFSGYYAQCSYFITGETRPYRNGRFRSLKPEGDYAYEVAFRHSNLDVHDRDSLQSNGEAYTNPITEEYGGVICMNSTIGFNVYFNNKVRVMADYIMTTLQGDLDTDPVVTELTASALTARAQYTF